MSEAFDRLSKLSPARLLLLAVELQAELEALRRSQADPIAIIGMGCRMPGGITSPEGLWDLLRRGGDAIEEVPLERWNPDLYYHPDPSVPGRMNTRWGGFVHGVDQFDASFFGIAPREAITLDPQQRLLLEVVWESLENAGLPALELAGSPTGVFVGIINCDYGKFQVRFGDPAQLDVYHITGSSLNAAAGRISFVLGLNGPSLAVDTACSSSLSAVHLACQSLRQQECSQAIVAGVNLVLSPDGGIALSRSRMMASDGRCKAFDARADGFVRSEGCVALVLKRLSDAVSQGDPILALIRGSAINQDGASSGLTVPNGLAQQAVIRQALARAGVGPERITYVEAHGTGTALGDPIEVEALAASYGMGHSAQNPLYVGSLKSNLGHLESAAGIAGVMKVVLALQHRAIPASLHVQTLNPRLDWASLPVQVPTVLTPWPGQDQPRMAGVSSFGVSGTNAHVILEEAPPRQDLELSSHAQAPHLLILSARSPAALMESARRMQAFLMASEPPALHDICYTAALRRSLLDHRLTVVGSSHQAMAHALSSYLNGAAPREVCSGAGRRSQPRVAFVFPGQGSQWPGMGRVLLRTNPVFRMELERCDAAIRQWVPWSVLEELELDEPASHLDQIDVVQPLLFAIEVALAAVWRSYGVLPQAVIGHSMGEVAAACVAGALSLQDASRIICLRSRLLRRISGKGAMALMELTREECQVELRGLEHCLSVAVSNSRRATVVSGDPEALEQLLATLEARGVFCRRVKVDVASHSPQVDPLTADLLEALDGLSPMAGQVDIYSTVTGEVIRGESCDPHYWVRNLRAPVLFSDQVLRLANDGIDVFIEMSPHPILLPAIEQTLEAEHRDAIALASLRRNLDEQTTLLEGLGALVAQGVDVKLDLLYPKGGRCVLLPNYPWQRESYWIDAGGDWLGPPSAHGTGSGGDHPLLGPLRTSSIHPDTWFWERTLDTRSIPFLADHRVHDRTVFPATGYLEMAIAGGKQVTGSNDLSLEEVAFEQPLLLPDEGGVELQLAIEVKDSEVARFSISSRDGRGGASWIRHASGSIRLKAGPVDAPRSEASPSLVPSTWTDQPHVTAISSEEHYHAMRARGVAFGPRFQGLQTIWHRPSMALGRLLPDPLLSAEVDRYHLHPGLLDACLQVLVAALGTQAGTATTYLPVGVGELRISGAIGLARWSYACLKTPASDGQPLVIGDVFVLDEEGRPLLEFRDVQARQVPGGALGRSAAVLESWLYDMAWIDKPLPVAASAPAQEGAGCWLVFDDAGGITEPIAQRLEQAGHRCFRLTRGQEGAAPRPGRWTLQEPSAQALAALLDRLFEQGRLSCPGILYGWGLDAGAHRDESGTLVEETLSSTVSLLALAQALVQCSWRNPPRLWVWTRAAVAALPGEDLNVAQAPLWGFVASLVHEHPEFHCTRLDLDGSSSEGATDSLLGELLTPDGEDQVAYRQGRRLVARMVPMEPALTGTTAPAGRFKAPARRSRPVSFDASALYLITGGLGGLGLAVARWMVERGARQLVLVGRREPSEEANAAVASLRDRGAVVSTASVDVADRQALAGLLDRLSAEGSPLRGIVHAAGQLDDASVQAMSPEQLTRVMAPKVAGAWNLHTLTRHLELDCFVLFSAGAALLGSPGQANYSAANTFLDALAYHRRAVGRSALSIDWGPWSGIGLVGGQEALQRLAFRGITAMSPEEGLTVLERLMRMDVTRAAVLPINLRQWREFHVTAASSPMFQGLDTRKGPGKAAPGIDNRLRMRLEEAPERAHELVEGFVREVVGQVLRLDPARLEPTTPLGKLGIDSLMSLEIRNRLEAGLGLTLSASLVWLHPTVTDLAQHLMSRLRPAARVSVEVRPGSEPDREELLAKIVDLSDEEAEALLLAELE